MKKMIVCFSVLSFLVVFAGCAGTAVTTKKVENEALLPEIDVVQVKENSDEALKLAQETKLDVEALSTKLTELDNKLILLSEEIAGVSPARIEEQENRLSLLVEAYKDLQAQVKTLEIMPPPKQQKTEATFSPAAANGILAPSPEYDSYHSGLHTFTGRNYAEALKIFADVIQQYPSGKYTDCAWYWTGECDYALNNFADAITAFQKVFTFQNSTKADDAQLKIGLCYLKLGQQQPARDEFRKLIDRYPSSEYVPRAKKYLEELK